MKNSIKNSYFNLLKKYNSSKKSTEFELLIMIALSKIKNKDELLEIGQAIDLAEREFKNKDFISELKNKLIVKNKLIFQSLFSDSSYNTSKKIFLSPLLYFFDLGRRNEFDFSFLSKKKQNPDFNTEEEEIFEVIPLNEFEYEQEEHSKKRIKKDDLEKLLYQPVQCVHCSMRFAADDKTYILHNSQHQRQLKAEKTFNERAFFPTIENWNCEKIDLNLKKIQEEKIFVDEKFIYCCTCKNKLEVKWDRDEDRWCVTDGIKISGNQFGHRKCIT